MRIALSLAAVLWLAAAPAFGFSADEALPDTTQEHRAIEVAGSLRCLVCQNQSILDSNAPLARDLRVIVRERVAAGDSDDQVRAYVVARYGDWVLLKPPFKPYTYLLWFGPLVLFAAAAAGVVVYLRRARRTAATSRPQALSAEEEARLQRQLADAGGEPSTRR